METHKLTIYCDVQIAIEHQEQQSNLPTEQQIIHWLTPVLSDPSLYNKTRAEFCVRFVNEIEMTELNSQYRHKQSATNVLSFPFEQPNGLPEPLDLLGDIILCCSIVEQEAIAQHKSIESHYAHLIIHGCLHLLGFDHIDDNEAQKMETLETKFMMNLGWHNPYLDEINN